MEALKGQKTLSELAQEHQLHPSQISEWKVQLQEKGVEVFRNKPPHQPPEAITRESELYEQIGRLKMEIEWLKKKAA